MKIPYSLVILLPVKRIVIKFRQSSIHIEVNYGKKKENNDRCRKDDNNIPNYGDFPTPMENLPKCLLEILIG